MSQNESVDPVAAYKLVVTSKIETTNSSIHEFKVLHKSQRAFYVKLLFDSVEFLIYYFKKHFKPCFFILKVLKDILKHIKFVNW